MLFLGAIPFMLSACIDPGCESSSQFHCEGELAKNCASETRRYLTKDCGAEGLQCAVGAREAFCALSSEPDERCETLAATQALETLLDAGSGVALAGGVARVSESAGDGDPYRAWLSSVRRELERKVARRKK